MNFDVFFSYDWFKHSSASLYMWKRLTDHQHIIVVNWKWFFFSIKNIHSQLYSYPFWNINWLKLIIAFGFKPKMSEISQSLFSHFFRWKRMCFTFLFINLNFIFVHFDFVIFILLLIYIYVLCYLVTGTEKKICNNFLSIGC